jgi:molecular chaperone GrpE
MDDKTEGSAALDEQPDVSIEVAVLKEQLEAAKKEVEKQAALSRDHMDTAKRVQAEFENYKRRTQREREDMVKCANDRLLADMLTVVDDFERALASKCSPEELRAGITKIHDNLSSLLEDYGLREIPSDGKFDPQYHEAFAVGEGEEGMILEVYQKGYFLGPKVLRYSKVKVAKKEGDNNG